MSGPVAKTHLRLPFGAPTLPLVLDAIPQHLPQKPRPGIIYIGDSQARAQNVTAALCARHGALPPGYYGAIDAVVESLAERALDDVVVVSRVRARLLLRRVMALVLGSWPGQGGLEEMRTALRRLRVAIAPAERDHHLRVIESSAADPALARRVELLRMVLASYDQALAREGLTDSADLEWVLARRAAETLNGIELLVIDDPYRLGPAQQHLLQAWSASVPHCLILTRSSDRGAWHEQASLPAHEFLERLCAPTEIHASVHRELRDRIPIAALHPVQVPWQFAMHTDPTEEARAVVREVRRLVQSGVALSRIRVCFVSKQQERAAQAIFARCGLPAVASERVSLARSVALSALLALYRAAANGFEREQTLAALRSPLLAGLARVVGRSKSQWAQCVSELAHAARMARVTAGLREVAMPQSWGQPLREWGKQSNVVTEGLMRPARQKLPVDSQRESTTTQRSLLTESEEHRQLVERVAPLFVRLARITMIRDLAGLLEDMLAMATELGLDDELSATGAERAEEQRGGESAPDPESVRELWRARRGLRRFRAFAGQISLSQRDTLSQKSEEDDPAAQPALGLRAALDELDEWLDELGEREREPGGVLLGGLLDAKDGDCDWLFVCGLVEEALPFPDRENAWLPRAVESLASGLATAERRALVSDLDPVEVYPYLFASIRHAAVRGLWLSAHAMDGDEPRGPSAPLAEFAREQGLDLGKMLEDARRLEPSTDHLSPVDSQLALAHTLAGATVDWQEHAGASVQTPLWLRPALHGMRLQTLRAALMPVVSPYKGHLDGEARRLVIDRLFDPAKRFSASMLETYAQCPQRFWYRYVLGIDEALRPDIDVAPTERGTFFHRVLERFLDTVSHALAEMPDVPKVEVCLDHAQGQVEHKPLIDIARWEKTTGRSARALLFALCEEELRASPIHSAGWHRFGDRLLASLAPEPAVVSELSRFLEFERASQVAGLFPLVVEFAFGKKGQVGLHVAHASDAQGFHLHGMVDRIDVLVRDDVPVALVVRDYKSGHGKYSRDFLRGLRFQLPLYSLAAAQALVGLAHGGYLYQKISEYAELTVDSDHVSREVAQALGLSSKASVDYRTLIEQTTPARLARLKQAMQAGRFHHAINGLKECRFCDYRLVCGLRAEVHEVYEQAAASLAQRYGMYAAQHQNEGAQS